LSSGQSNHDRVLLADKSYLTSFTVATGADAPGRHG